MLTAGSKRVEKQIQDIQEKSEKLKMQVCCSWVELVTLHVANSPTRSSKSSRQRNNHNKHQLHRTSTQDKPKIRYPVRLHWSAKTTGLVL